MRTTKRNQRGGQVLVMVTLALVLICGMLGLVVDLGWSYFTKKAAQSAADAAAMAAVQKVMDGVVSAASYTCTGGNATCAAAPVACPGASGNLTSACIYAAKLGFDPSADPRVQVTVEASDQITAPTVIEGCGQAGATVHHPPTTGCVDTYYWVTVRVQQTIPQLFSAILGNTTGGASARATAGVARSESISALILLNRQNDPWYPAGPNEPNGENLIIGGTPTITVPGGIALSSNANGGGSSRAYAGIIQGGGTVTAPFTHIRTGGTVSLSNNGTWQKPPDNQPDGSWFQDPYQNVLGTGVGGQPPVIDTALPLRPVPGGALNTTVCPNGVCSPGNYFAIGPQPGCNQSCPTVATGAPITVGQGTFTFTGAAASGIGEYYFFGGLQAQQSQLTLGPGRYVFAGVRNQRDPVFSNDNATAIVSSGPNGSDAGRVLILTDSTYPGLSTQVGAIVQGGYPLSWAGPGSNQLLFSNASIQTGNNNNSRVSLNGLNADDPNMPAGLKPFAVSPNAGQGAGVVIWQDQRNSIVTYTSTGQVDTSCGSLDSPCYNTLTSGSSPQLQIWATPFASYNGVIYQPRGAWTVLQASGDYQGPIRIVSGALSTQGSGTLSLSGVSPPIQTPQVALIE